VVALNAVVYERLRCSPYPPCWFFYEKEIMRTKDVKDKLTRRTKERVLTGKDFLSTGSTMLNLACSGYPDRGFAKGHYYLIQGTTRSGKTFLALTCLAEAAKNPEFKNYHFIHDDVERGALMNIQNFFGVEVERRLKTIHSYKIEDFYDNLDTISKKGFPFIYILDSMDALTSEFEIEKFAQQKKARKQDKDTAGSFGDGKAKVNSQNLRRAMKPLEKTGSILIIVNQKRDKLTGYGGSSYSGGNALPHYASLIIRSDVKINIKKTYKGKERLQGTLCTLRVFKNRIQGKDRTIEMPIYSTYGMDDISSCVDYILSEKHWKKTSKGIIAPEFDFKGKRSKLISMISNENMEMDLSMIAADVWKEIEDAVAIKRKKRYE